MQLPHSAATDTHTDVELTNDELQRLEECMKDRTFRDLLSEYVKEISDPRTHSEYEAYLKSVEESGDGPLDRRLMKPVPSFCVKAKAKPKSISITNHDDDDATPPSLSSVKKHIFINFCSGDLVKDALLCNAPNASPDHGQSELCWQIPYVLGHRRCDASSGDIIYDIAFSVKTIALCLQEKTFETVAIRTAMEAVNSNDVDYELLGIDAEHNGKRHKILKSVQYKGNVAPPIMSVCVDSITGVRGVSGSKLLNQQTKQSKQSKQYKIIESSEKSMESCWNDRSLQLQRPKQIHVVIALQHFSISSIKDVECRLSLRSEKKQYYTLHVSVKHDADQTCAVDLQHYEILPSSMNAVWYHSKQELRVTFDIKPLQQPLYTKKEFEGKCEQKIELDIDHDDDHDEGTEPEFMLREVCSKRLDATSTTTTTTSELKEAGTESEQENKFLCHHQLPMQRVVSSNGKTAHWICSEPLDQRCTAFKWDSFKSETTKKQLTTFEIEQREKLNKVVLLVRVTNIIASSVQIAFKETGDVDIEFETHQHRYYKHVKLESDIDIEQCKFDANDRNLLIMAAKQQSTIVKYNTAKQNENEEDNDCDGDVCQMLNDPALFEID
eukprot:CAMPEP_0202687690 /NCGR_PEP_ID=MMETSP1385-20130828/3343_1 /ASSEMBLY_ACC=CAM_ASM_000861 /TAXON_ID=933848 /ORGANISM="Elphidium margaritaceum" /LENGTH=609 /DNA_ID=CAMNT_0049342525 /DNA_START=18 /DNA_END=1847 /DNA_ORIENTATION=+